MDLNIRRRWLRQWLTALAHLVLPNKIRTADALDVPLVELAALISKLIPSMGKRFSFLPMMPRVAHIDCVFGNRLSTVRTTQINVQRMKSEDKEHLIHKCFHIRCYKISIGVLKRDVLMATMPYDMRLAMTPPKSLLPITAETMERNSATFTELSILGVDLSPRAM